MHKLKDFLKEEMVSISVLSIAALPLHRDGMSEDILVCKPTENNLLLHFCSAAALED